MSKPITVVKAKQKKPLSYFALLRLFIRLVTYSTWSEVYLANLHKSRRVNPASVAGGLIDYRVFWRAAH